MKKSNYLIRTKALISDPNNWCQNNFAQDAAGRAVDSCSTFACKRCATGALTHICAPLRSDDYYDIKEYLCKALEEIGANKNSIADFNDKNDHESVMKLFDRAIELAKADEDVVV